MKALASYLNDHLAGSVAAVELLEHLIKSHECTPRQKFFETLHADVTADQEVLRELLQRISGESTIRKAGGWIAEKIGRLKIKASGENPGELGFLEALEALVLGITGKQLLWRALNASLGGAALLRGTDLQKLAERASEQLERVEALRLEAARAAFYE